MTNVRTQERARSPRVGRWSAAALVIIAFGAARVSASADAAASKGNVDVLFAGSLLDLMNGSIAPAFHKATGYTVQGLSGGSSTLANEIKDKTEVADVFISASPKVTATLMGTTNGGWLSSYDEFATSPLVLGYNPASTFAAALRTEPWYLVVDRPGFLLGRTDPASDPKGVLAVKALQEAAREFTQPALARLAMTSAEVFPETTLVGRLQSGQLDAGFFYRVESVSAKIPTVALSGTTLAATYTVAVLNGAPHAAAARAFVDFLLGTTGRAMLARNGVTPMNAIKVVTTP